MRGQQIRGYGHKICCWRNAHSRPEFGLDPSTGNVLAPCSLAPYASCSRATSVAVAAVLGGKVDSAVSPALSPAPNGAALLSRSPADS